MNADVTTESSLPPSGSASAEQTERGIEHRLRGQTHDWVVAINSKAPGKSGVNSSLTRLYEQAVQMELAVVSAVENIAEVNVTISQFKEQYQQNLALLQASPCKGEHKMPNYAPADNSSSLHHRLCRRTESSRRVLAKAIKTRKFLKKESDETFKAMHTAQVRMRHERKQLLQRERFPENVSVAEFDASTVDPAGLLLGLGGFVENVPHP